MPGPAPQLEPLDFSIAGEVIARAAANADKVAVTDGTTTLTYRQLLGRAVALEAALTSAIEPAIESTIESRPDPDLPIGILLPNDTSYLVAILALLLSGRTAVPLDPAHPEQRLGRIIGCAGLAAVIVGAETAELLDRIVPALPRIDVSSAIERTGGATPPRALLPPDRVLMINFTSGSTDEPKGVCVSARSLFYRLKYLAAESALVAEDHIPLLQSMSGAASIRYALDALRVGAQVGIVDPKRLGLAATRDFLGRFCPTAYVMVPSTFRVLFGADDARQADLTRGVRWVRMGSERVLRSDVELYRRRFAPSCRLVVSVGTTETGTCVAWAIDHATALDQNMIPVGRPVPGVELELIGDDGAVVAPGESGEICITSDTLAAGYWRDETLTAQRFGPSPTFSGMTRYRTGDYGRFLKNGLLEFIGRRDRQVKVRGNTVNLGEVEIVLGACPFIGEVGVVARQADEATVLIAYCTPAPGTVMSEAQLRQWCRAELAAPMRPAHFFTLAALPRLPTGKIDLRALAERDRRQASAAGVAAAAASPPAAAANPALANIVRQAWTDVLAKASFDADMNFESAGGDSLKGLDLLVRLETLMGRPVAVGTLGLDTRPSELIRRIERGPESDAAPNDARPTIVLFLGMWGDDVHTSDFHRVLEQHFRLIAIDGRLGGDALSGDYDATRYFAAVLDAVRRMGPHRRLWLVGFSYGGKLAAETARRLLASGTAVEAVIVLDGAAGPSLRELNAARRMRRGLAARLRSGLADHGGVARYLFNALAVRTAPLVVRFRAFSLLRGLLAALRRFGSERSYRMVSRSVIALSRRRAFGDLPNGVLPMPLWLFMTDDPLHADYAPDLGWGGRCRGVNRIVVGGLHKTMLAPPIRDIVVEELLRLDGVLLAGAAATASPLS